MKNRLHFILVMTALLCATCGGAFADAYSQFFTGWDATTTQNPVDASKDEWYLNDGYIKRNGQGLYPWSNFPKSPHPLDTADCACWLADDVKSTNSSLTTPLLTFGVGSISFYTRNYAAGFNNFALQTSANGVVWITLTNLQHTTETWTQYQYAINQYQSVYLRILKTGENGGHPTYGQLLGLDDIIITRPPAFVAISHAQSDPEYPIRENPIDLACRITPYSDASGLTVTSFWRVGTSGSWTPAAMTTNGSATNYITISPIPAHGPNDQILQYYITAYFSGTNAMSPTNYPVGGASAPSTLVYREPIYSSYYTNLAVTGSFNTNLALIGDYLRQGVISVSTNIIAGSFQFLATNAGGNIMFGEANQPFTSLPVFGVADTNGAAIAVSGTNTGYFVFRFDETVNDYSAQKCAYIVFDDWTGTKSSFGTYTNSEGWIISNARTTTDGDETNKAYTGVGNSCVLRDTGNQPYVISSPLSNGVGEISFWYRNWETNGLTPTAFDVQISTSATGGWATVSAVTNIVNVDYKRFSHTLSDATNYYLRILHATNPPRARLLLDEIVIAEPGPGVWFSNLVQTPPSPTILDAVDVQVNISAWNRATNLNAKLWHRYGTTGAFDAISMTNAGATFDAVSDVPRYPPGAMQYYIECSFDGLSSKERTYFYYPQRGSLTPMQYVIADSVPTQYFWTGWSATVTTNPADVSQDGWSLNDGYIHRNALTNSPFPGYTFPTSPYPANSNDCAAWLADRGASTNSYFLTPQLTAGVGRISFYRYTFYSGSNDFSIQTSTNLGDWTSVTNLKYSAGSWALYTNNIYDSRSIYLRIFKTDESGGHSTWGQLLGLDDIKISYAPAMVLITNVMTHPGYPSEGEDVNISCVITSTHPYFPARNISARVYYRQLGAGSYSGPIEMTGNGDYFLTQSEIPGQSGDARMEYYIECAFNGYAYTNVENHSPTFYPAGTPGILTNQYYAAPTNNPAVYAARRHKSEYDHVEVTGNVGVVTMELTGDNEWQGILNLRDMATPTNRLAINFAGIGQYTNMANAYSAAVPSWGDSYQFRFSLPMASAPQDDASNIVININTQEQDQIMFRYDTVKNFYTITRAAYQDFDEWQAPEDSFAESFAGPDVITLTNVFDSWPTSVTEVAQSGIDLEDFTTWAVTSAYYSVATLGSVGWYVENALILDESGQNGSNNACRLRNVAGLGTVWPRITTVSNGVKTFGFDYRAREDDHYHTWYANGVNWTNYYVQATLRSTNMAPDFPYLSMLARYQNEDNYYELRLQQMSSNKLNVSLWRRANRSYSQIATSAWFTGSLNDTNICGFLVVTNDAGDVYLEGNVSVAGATNTASGYDTNAVRITSPGSIGFLTRGADIAVDDIAVRRADIYITESTNIYAESFTNGQAQNWDAPYGKWYLPATNNTTYNRAGYARAPLGFDIQMAFSGGTVLDDGSGANWITVRSLTASNLDYKAASYDFEYWDDIFVRVRHTTADASLVVDNLALSSWRGESYSDSNGWAAAEAWVVQQPGATNRYVELWRSRADVNTPQYVRSPRMTNGIGDINFYYRTTNGPAQLEVQRTVEGTTNTYVTVQTLTLNTNSWTSYTAQMNTTITGLYVRLVHSSAINTNVLHLNTNNEAIVAIDNFEIRDYAERDQTMWYAYNALVTHKQDDKEFEPYYTPSNAVRSCYLNNSPSRDAPSGPFTNDFAFVQSAYLAKGIGEISFWYRAWDTNTAVIRVRTAESETLSPAAWSYLFEISDITNTFYRYFTTNFYITDQRFLRIYSSNEPAGRVCIDNVLISEPLGADFDIVNATLTPQIPLYTSAVGVSAQLTGFLLDPSDIDLRIYYNVGSNNWGNWAEGVNYVTLTNVSNTMHSRFYEVPAGQGIPPQPIDTVVQYHLYCAFNGTFADKASPKREKSFTNPAWYYPVDLNAGQSYTNPYYFVFSCPTGRVWINEFNILDGFWEFTYSNQYVELCGYANTIISNWRIEVLNTSFVTTQVYRITNNATIPNDYAGYGFWALGSNGVAAADMLLTNTLPTDGGLLLRRSMGAYEHGVCYGSSIAAQNMTNSPHRFVYVGEDDDIEDWSLGLIGAGSNTADFVWTNNISVFTPGVRNSGQTLVWFSSDIVVTNFRIAGSTNWIVATGPSTWMPTVWYSTNLLDTNAWMPIADAGYVYSDNSGSYTHWFSAMTNSRHYFYKITATNSL